MPFSVRLITPFGTVAERDDAEFVFASGAVGDLGILPGHAPFLAPLAVGEVRIEAGGDAQRFAVSEGFVEAGPKAVTIMAKSAEVREDIDIERAREAQKRAEERLEDEPDDIDMVRAEAALARAMNRVTLAHRGE